MKQQRRDKSRPGVEPLESRLVPATINVTTHLDQNNGPTGGISLRDAINMAADGDTIIVPANTYTLTIPGRNEDAGATGDLDINKNVTIRGAGANATIINASGIDRALYINPGPGLVRLEGLTIRGGRAFVEPLEDEARGGGIRHDSGTLELHRVIVRDNVAEGDDVFDFFGAGVPAEGGGIWSEDELSVLDSRVLDNRAEGGDFSVSGGEGSGDGGYAEGGGIYSRDLLTLVNSTVDGNLAQGGAAEAVDFGSGFGGDAAGGGIGIGGFGGFLITLSGSTVSNNTARGGTGVSSGGMYGGDAFGGDAEGGGVFTDTDTEFLNSTVSGNTAQGGNGSDNGSAGDASGAGVYLLSSLGLFQNSTVTDNSALAGTGGFGGGLGEGGGVFVSGSIVAFENNILAGNSVQDSLGMSNETVDVGLGSGTIVSLGFNFVGVDDFDDFDDATDITGTSMAPADPELGPLANNGGLTQTHTPLFGSPVINVGGGEGAGDPDQRGVPRPVGMQADIGAVEYSDAPKLLQFNVLYGAMKFDLLDPFNPIRVNLPWRVTGIEAVFTEAVTGTAASLTGVPAIATFTGSGTATLRWTFGTGVQTAILNAALVAAGITDTGGDTSDNQLDGNCDGTGGDNFTRTVRVLFGDFNDDSVVSAADFVAINQRRTATNPYNPFADLDGDGDVDAADVNLARSRVGQMLPPPS